MQRWGPSCPSWPTRRAPSAWPTCSSRWASTAAWASAMRRRTSARCWPTAKQWMGKFCPKRASARPVPLRTPTAAATSYSVHGVAMLPFYIYYSMFGFQRVGDAIWAAADRRARGFLLGATSGSTTLGGEGLQHQERHQPPGGGHHPQLQGLRPGLCGRNGGHRGCWHARDGDRAARRFLLRHADERELRPARPACRDGRRRAAWLLCI